MYILELSSLPLEVHVVDSACKLHVNPYGHGHCSLININRL